MVESAGSENRLHIAVDVGGTFTDICVVDRGPDGDSLRIAKTSSTPGDITEGILTGLREADVDLGSAALFVHGTTVATNALITRSFPRTAMVTTKGFRDVVEIRRGTREEIYDPYVQDVAPPYIRRRDRFVVEERIDSSGNVITPLDEEGVRRLAESLRRREVASVAICLINSHANPGHELRVQEILAEELPGVHLTASSEVLPEIFEHDRFSTATANAVLKPVVSGYVRDLDQKLTEEGSETDLLLLHCGGGVMTAATAERFAARLASSGTAAGAIAVQHVGSACGFENVIGLDMGGTSADISLVYGGELRMTRDWAVEYGYPIRFPSIELLTIGAGGGSHAWIDSGGALRSGPQSAGAEPGPVCYERGNQIPTNTDANLVLGRLGSSLIGGAIELNREAAYAAIKKEIADPLGLDVDEASSAMIKVANANMADAIRKISIGRGYDPRDFALVAFGGAGPLHAADIARDLAIPTVIVPPSPGVASALGCLLVDVRHDLTRMHLTPLEGIDEAALRAVFEDLEREAASLLEAEGIGEEGASIERSVDMRYLGQWRSLTVPLEGDSIGEALGAAVARFHEGYEREHNYRRDDAPIELYQAHVTAIGSTHGVQLPRGEVIRHEARPASSRSVRFDDGSAVDEAPIYIREELAPGASFNGPAVVEQLDSTVVVPVGARALVDEWLNLRLELEA